MEAARGRRLIRIRPIDVRGASHAAGMPAHRLMRGDNAAMSFNEHAPESLAQEA
jgi:hypothetical protein